MRNVDNSVVGSRVCDGGPLERAVEKGKKLTTLTNYGAQYQVKFEMLIEKWIPQVASVFHIGKNDASRRPAVFLHPSKKLQINVNHKTKYLHPNMETGRWYSIDISKVSAGNNVGKILVTFL